MNITMRRLSIAFGISAIIGIVTPIGAIAGAPLKGVDVKLGKNPGGKPAARTVKSSKSNTNDKSGGQQSEPSGIAVSDPGADGSKPKKGNKK